MEGWKKLQEIRDNYLDDKTIVDELIQYLSDDELKDFADHLCDVFDIDDLIGE